MADGGFRLALLGDVMLGRGVAEEIGHRGPETFWTDVGPLLFEADHVIGNLECAITTHATPWSRTPKVFHFRTPPEAVELLHAASVTAVSLANNHVLDFEEPGLFDTLRHLDEAGIAHAGAGENLSRAVEPALIRADGVTIGLLAFTDNEPDWAAGPDRPGTSYLEIGPDPHALAAVETGVRRAREKDAEIVVMSLHWGPNMMERPPSHFRAFARAALERGVDLIHGHSAHVFQGVEVHNGRPILYDTGDALDDYAVDPVLRNDRSFVFFAEGEGSRVRRLRLVPIRLRYARTELARGDDFEATCQRLEDLSAEMGTVTRSTEEGLEIEIQPESD